MQYGRLILAAINLHLIIGLPLCGAMSGEQTSRQFADSTHVSGAAPRPFNHGAITRTCYARNGPPNGVPSGPLLARRLLAKPLPHIPEVSRRVTAAEFGADAKLDCRGAVASHET